MSYTIARKPTSYERSMGQLVSILLRKRVGDLLAQYVSSHKQDVVRILRLEPSWRTALGYEIDFAIFRKEYPMTLLETRYQKRGNCSADKSKQIVERLVSVRDGYPSAACLVVVLAGDRSKYCSRLASQHSVRLLHIDSRTIASNLSKYGVIVDRRDDDQISKMKSWRNYASLSLSDKESAKRHLLDGSLIPMELKSIVDDCARYD
jgi:hypothetical protein